MRIPPPPKAAYGSPCSSCGQCCENELCPLGSAVFDPVDGPCPALGYDAEGKSFCGLVVNPAAFDPVRTFLAGRETMSQGAAVLIGAGHGCDALRDDEPEPPGACEGLFARARAVPRFKAQAALRAWGLTWGLT